VLGARLWGKQHEIARAMVDTQFVYVPSCHASGKSFTSAQIALWFLYSHPNSIVVTTAPTGRQVRKVMWQEIRRAYTNAPVPLGGDLLQTELKIDDKWYAFGFSTDQPTNFSGIHADWVLVIVDEATGIAADIWEGISGVLANQNTRLLAIGNPTDGASEFAARIRRAGERTAVIPISCYDTPNFTTFGITEADIVNRTWRDKLTGSLPMPYLITPQWVADIYERYGADSAMYISRCLGRFPESSADTLIPLAWVLNAVERWKDVTEQLKQGRDVPLGPDKQLGVDVARFGVDRTARTYRQGAYVHWQRVTQQESLMQTAGRVANDLTEQKMPCNVDVIGLGAGVVDRLKELHYDVYGVNVAEKATDAERFANLRAEGYWRLRERFERGQIMIPDDDELINELTSLKYKIVNSNGQIRMEEKEEMKKRLGKSPDLADSLCLAFLEPPQGPDVVIEFI
jgi:phage terminase large subunit